MGKTSEPKVKESTSSKSPKITIKKEKKRALATNGGHCQGGGDW